MTPNFIKGKKYKTISGTIFTVYNILKDPDRIYPIRCKFDSRETFCLTSKGEYWAPNSQHIPDARFDWDGIKSNVIWDDK